MFSFKCRYDKSSIYFRTPSKLSRCVKNRTQLAHAAVRSSGLFVDDEIVHVEGEVDPVRDLFIIHEELRLKDEDYLRKNLESMEKTVGRGSDKARKAELVSDSLSLALDTPPMAAERPPLTIELGRYHGFFDTLRQRSANPGPWAKFGSRRIFEWPAWPCRQQQNCTNFLDCQLRDPD